jgi:tetratricopeptide (TPR) repeat protein
MNEGMNNLHLGNYDQAIQAWRRALDLSPENAVAANNIGSAYMAMEQPSAALPWFEKAIALDPNLQIAKNNLVWAKSEQAKSGQ